MTDQEKELIELAAKAMGYDYNWQGSTCFIAIPFAGHAYEVIEFNPLTSRDDRAMLMDALEIDLYWNLEDDKVTAFKVAEILGEEKRIMISEYHNGTPSDRERAANLAVTRVAAEKGHIASTSTESNTIPRRS